MASTRWLAVLPAVAVFALLVGVLRADGAPEPTQQAPQPPPQNPRDAWDVPVADFGKPPAGMTALLALPERSPPMSRADFDAMATRRNNLPATKAAVVFTPETYETYLASMARQNRLRVTRFWYSGEGDTKAASLLGTLTAPVVGCAEYTWAFAHEYTVSFDLAPNRSLAHVATDGPPALTKCLADLKPLGSRPETPKPGTKVVMSFVLTKG